MHPFGFLPTAISPGLFFRQTKKIYRSVISFNRKGWLQILFPSLPKILLSLFYTVLQSAGIIAIFVVLSLVYIPLRFCFWAFVLLVFWWYDVVLFLFAAAAAAKETSTTKSTDLQSSKKSKGDGKKMGRKSPAPGRQWIDDTPETSPLKLRFKDEGETKEQTAKEEREEALLVTPQKRWTRQNSEEAARSERVDSVMRGGRDETRNLHF
jgi:hypothetical protein